MYMQRTVYYFSTISLHVSILLQMALWLSFSKGLSDFVRAVADKNQSQLFEMFLKYEVEKEKQSSKKELAGK